MTHMALQTITITAGALTSVLVSAPPGYPATDGWAMRMRLVSRTVGQFEQTVNLVGEGADYRLTIAGTLSESWTPGAGSYTAWLERGTDVVHVGAGSLEVLPDPRAISAGWDARSLARRTLDDLMTALAAWDTTGGRAKSYTIAGRSMTFVDHAELVAKVEFWRNQVAAEESAARLAAGKRPRNRILVRFGRPR